MFFAGIFSSVCPARVLHRIFLCINLYFDVYYTLAVCVQLIFVMQYNQRLRVYYVRTL